MNPAGAFSNQLSQASFAMLSPYVPSGPYGATPMVPLQPAPAPVPTSTQAVATIPLQPAPPQLFDIPAHEVWADNFHDVEATIGYFFAHASCVAVNVQYPGLVVHGAGQDLRTITEEQRYAIMKANVDALEPLQVGLTICTDDGLIAAWEFHLSDCDELRRHGVPMAKIMRVLRLIGRPGVSLVTHAGAYHVAFVLRIISGGNKLPGDVAGFLRAVRRSLGDDVYDVARMAADCRDLPVGLERIARRLGLATMARPLSVRLPTGAASALTVRVFLQLQFHPYGGNVLRFRGILQGLQLFEEQQVLST